MKCFSRTTIDGSPAAAFGLFFSLALLFASPAQAATWNSSNIQILQGDDYELGEEERMIFTFENALGWKYGDSFLFIDVTEPLDEGTTYYSEFSPRFSLGSISGNDLSTGIIKDYMISTTFEMGEGVRGTLLGIGLPLDIPGFAFANFNFYLRDSERDFVSDQTDTGYQITLSWKKPFMISTTKWSFEGFFDYAFGEDGGSAPKEDNIITAPRLLMDIGDLWGSPGAVEAGIEYQIWRNKFGIDGVDEDVVQFMVKAIF